MPGAGAGEARGSRPAPAAALLCPHVPEGATSFLQLCGSPSSGVSCCPFHAVTALEVTVASAFVSTELKKPGEGGLAREARAVTFQSDPGLGPVTREQGQWGPWGSRRRRERGEAGREEGSRRRGSLRRVRAVWHLLYEEIPVKKNAFSPKGPCPLGWRWEDDLNPGGRQAPVHRARGSPGPWAPPCFPQRAGHLLGGSDISRAHSGLQEAGVLPHGPGRGEALRSPPKDRSLQGGTQAHTATASVA